MTVGHLSGTGRCGPGVVPFQGRLCTTTEGTVNQIMAAAGEARLAACDLSFDTEILNPTNARYGDDDFVLRRQGGPHAAV